MAEHGRSRECRAGILFPGHFRTFQDISGHSRTFKGIQARLAGLNVRIVIRLIGLIGMIMDIKCCFASFRGWNYFPGFQILDVRRNAVEDICHGILPFHELERGNCQ